VPLLLSPGALPPAGRLVWRSPVGSTGRGGRESPLFRLVEQHLEDLLRLWPQRFSRTHGPLRPVVERVLRGFLKWGIVFHGFARLWCPTCRTSVLCPLNCWS
jgi:hypothetical protein